MKGGSFVKAWLLGAAGVLIVAMSEIPSVWSAIPERQHVPLLGFGMVLMLLALYYYYRAYRSVE
jgi:uncharacterized membrane protein